MLLKKGSIKHIIIGIVILFFITLFAFLYLSNKLLSPRWPIINNPSALLKECNPLLRNVPSIIEDANNWPESIKSLSPITVIGTKNYVDIRISGGGIGNGWGYLVYPDFGPNALVPIDYIILGSVYPGIFRYEAKQS